MPFRVPLTYDGFAEGFRYDPASQVQQILHQLGASGPTINQAAYTYNGVGNRDSLTDRRGPQTFGYDNFDRLTSASYPWLGTPQAFTYDAVARDTTGEPYAFEWWDVETWCRISLRLL